MCGIVMVGRTGPAYATQFGTIQVHEEKVPITAKSNLFAAAESGGFAVLIFPLLIFIKK
jgi:hypothetical protein